VARRGGALDDAVRGGERCGIVLAVHQEHQILQALFTADLGEADEGAEPQVRVFLRRARQRDELGHQRLRVEVARDVRGPSPHREIRIAEQTAHQLLRPGARGAYQILGPRRELERPEQCAS